jgi:hypothetical protein
MFFVAGIAQGGYFEALYLPDVRYTELGFTEFTQTLVLASCCGLLIYVRQVLKVWPTVTLLLLAFVAASLVREQDYFLDYYVADNSWKVLVSLIVIPSLAWVVVQRRRFIEEFSHYSNTFAFGLFTGGVLVTYIFWFFVTSCGFGLIEQAAHRTADQVDHRDEVGLVPVATCA